MLQITSDWAAALVVVVGGFVLTVAGAFTAGRRWERRQQRRAQALRQLDTAFAELNPLKHEQLWGWVASGGLPDDDPERPTRKGAHRERGAR